MPQFIIFVCSAAWFTHVITCLADDRWGFLIAGAIMFPIGIIHGIGIWFGAFWHMGLNSYEIEEVAKLDKIELLVIKQQVAINIIFY